jgi:ABC transport system ATP-binding/permease protein
MVAQRGYGLAGPLGAPAEIAQKAAKRPADRAASKRKMGFNEKRALETLPGRIEKLRVDLGVLERKLAHADFPILEPAAFKATTRSYGDLRAQLAKAEEEWLGLEILREELEQQ